MLRIALISITFALANAAVQAQSNTQGRTEALATSDDRPGTLIHELIAATNSGDKQSIRQFMLTNASKKFLDALPIDAVVDDIAGMGAQHGGFRYQAMRKTAASPANPSLQEFFVQGLRSKEWFKVALVFSSNKQFKIEALDSQASSPPGN